MCPEYITYTEEDADTAAGDIKKKKIPRMSTFVFSIRCIQTTHTPVLTGARQATKVRIYSLLLRRVSKL